MHLPIPTGATWGCWGVSNHERRPAWPPVTAPTEKKNSWELLVYIGLAGGEKMFFKKYHEKETQLRTHNLESEDISRSSSTFWVFLPLSFFCSKKSCCVKWPPGDFRRCEGRGGCFVLVGQPHKMFVEDFGDGPGKGRNFPAFLLDVL